MNSNRWLSKATQNSRPTPWRRKVYPATVLLSVVGVLCLIPNRSARHPTFGRIHTTVAMDDALPMENLRRKLRIEPLLSWFSLWQRRDYVLLNFEGHRMFWWDRQWKPERRGCLQFQTTRAPQDIWEFAPCSRSRLEDVRWTDLKSDFFSSTNPAGKTAFGADWKTNGQLTDTDTGSAVSAIDVREGQVVLARLVTEPSRIYAIEINKQDMRRESGGARLTVRYLAIDAMKDSTFKKQRDE